MGEGFEFDPNKSQANRIKHGIDFLSAQELWDDENRLVIPAQTKGEVRFALIGRIGHAFWTAIYTIRNEKIRIISVRRSRNEEKKIYYQDGGL